MNNKVMVRAALTLASFLFWMFATPILKQATDDSAIHFVLTFVPPCLTLVFFVSICTTSFDGNGRWMNDWELGLGKLYVVTAVENTGEESHIESRNTAVAYAVLRPVAYVDKDKDDVLLVRFKGCHLQVGHRVMGVSKGWLKLHSLAGSAPMAKLVVVGGAKS